MLRRLLTVRGRFVAAGAGAGLTLSFAPFSLWWLAPLLLTLIFLLIEGASGRERTLRGFWFGFGMFATGTYWLYISIHDFGGVAPPIAVAICGALILLMAVYLAGWGYLSGLVAPGNPAWQLLAVLPASWVGVEWLRGWLFSGFPWLSLGYGQIDGPLAAWAPVVGVHGVSLLVALGAGALSVLIIGPNRARIAGLGVLAGGAVLTVLLTGREWTSAGGGSAAGRAGPGRHFPGPEVAAGRAGDDQGDCFGTSRSNSGRPISSSGRRPRFPRWHMRRRISCGPWASS